MLARLRNALKYLLTVVAHILPILFDLGIAGIHSGRDLLPADALNFPKFLHKAFDHAVPVVDGQKRLDKANVLLAQDIHINANVLRIGRNNRTVEMIGR